MPNAKNLKPFRPGNDTRRNVKGRPVGAKNRATVLAYWLETTINTENKLTGAIENITIEDAIALALIQKAITGDVAAIREIYDSVHGKVTEKQEISNVEAPRMVAIRIIDTSQNKEVD
jgi:hypothetical protein